MADRKSFAKKSYNAAEGSVTFDLAHGEKVRFNVRTLPTDMIIRAAMFGIAQTLGDLGSKEDVTNSHEFLDAIMERWDQIMSGEWEKRGRDKMTDAEKLAMYKKMVANLERKAADAGEVPDL